MKLTNYQGNQWTQFFNEVKHFKYKIKYYLLEFESFFLIPQTAAAGDASSAVSLEPENCKAHTRKG